MSVLLYKTVHQCRLKNNFSINFSTVTFYSVLILVSPEEEQAGLVAAHIAYLEPLLDGELRCHGREKVMGRGGGRRWEGEGEGEGRSMYTTTKTIF